MGFNPFIYVESPKGFSQNFKDKVYRQRLGLTSTKMQIVSQIALMFATILLFWGSEQKIVQDSRKMDCKLLLVFRFKKLKILNNSLVIFKKLEIAYLWFFNTIN